MDPLNEVYKGQEMPLQRDVDVISIPFGKTITLAEDSTVVVMQAKGNIKDGSNKREVVFDYGFPTANQIYGFTLEVNELKGFSLYTEFNVNHRFKQYPNRRRRTLRSFSGIVGARCCAHSGRST